MKKFCLLLALVLLLAPVARADLLYYPEDDFQSTHRCDYLNQGYIANGSGDSVTVYASPESNVVRGHIPNGQGMCIYYLYTDERDIQWGFVESQEATGWIPMVYLVRSYDGDCFLEEFAERLVYPDEWQTMELPETVYLWDYPGDGYAYEETVEAEHPLHYGISFTDDAGRVWAYIHLEYGIRDKWVCLDDPDADYEELYAELPPQTVTPPTAPEHPAVEITPGGISLGGVLAGVGVLAAVCLGFLVLTRKKKN